jgi:hypothetical protein
MAVLVFEKADLAPMQNVFTQLPKKFRRFRSCLFKVADTFYFKELRGPLLDRHLHTAIREAPDLKSVDDISRLVSQEQNTLLTEDGVQWRIWLAPDYSVTESVAVLKMHHSIGDGISLMLLLGFLQPEYEP